MKTFLSAFMICLVALSAGDAPAANMGRLGVQGKVMSTARMPSMPVKSIGVATKVSKANTVTEEEPTEPEQQPSDPEPETPAIDMREKEREACIRNNIGVGNTFVWASRYSDITNYATMIEDVEKPDNNACFVRVELKSSDPRIDLSDLTGKYFEMGRNIVCGSWVDESIIEKRILDAKKKGRTWATVGGAVGGAALGVGSMELFGNRLINGAVEGQLDKSLSDEEQFRSYVLSLDASERTALVNYANKMVELCQEAGANAPAECNGVVIGDIGDEPFSYEYIAGISAK